MDESYCMTNTAFYVGMLSPACSPAQSSMQSSIEAMRCWAQHFRPDSAVWPVHTYCVWPCQVPQKYSCTVQSISGLRQALRWWTRHIAPRHILELTLEVILKVILEHVLRIKIMTSLILDHVARAYLYLGISTGEKVMILLSSHSLGVVTGQNKTY